MNEARRKSWNGWWSAKWSYAGTMIIGQRVKVKVIEIATPIGMTVSVGSGKVGQLVRVIRNWLGALSRLFHP